MPVSIPVATRSPGDLLTSALWNSVVRDNINKLLERGHRVLTVAQFAALTGLEGTKGTVAPDEVYLEVDSANGIQWHLAYESGEATYKWRFLGGPPMFSEVITSEPTTSTTYVDLATVGPSITLPRAGDYLVGWGTGATSSVSGNVSYGAFKRGAAAAADVDAIVVRQAVGTYVSNGFSRERVAAALAALDVIKLQYRGDGVTHTFHDRSLSILPRRIS